MIKGIGTSNAVQMEAKQEQSKNFIATCKSILDTKDFLKFTNCVKELRSNTQISEVFKNLRETMFSKVKNVKGDKRYSEKIQVMEDLGDLIKNHDKKQEFLAQLEDLKMGKL